MGFFGSPFCCLEVFKQISIYCNAYGRNVQNPQSAVGNRQDLFCPPNFTAYWAVNPAY